MKTQVWALDDTRHNILDWCETFTKTIWIKTEEAEQKFVITKQNLGIWAYKCKDTTKQDKLSVTVSHGSSILQRV